MDSASQPDQISPDTMPSSGRSAPHASTLASSDIDRIDRALANPVFIVGAPRSGTTWVQRLVLGHPKVCGGQESNFFEVFGRAIRNHKFGQSSERRVGLASYWREEDLKARIMELYRETFAPLLEQQECAEILVEKTPMHSLFMDVIRELVPGARFIHLIRDSRSVVASLLAASKDTWGKSWAPKNARQAVELWQQFVDAAQRYGKTLSSQNEYLEIYYEDLRRNPDRGLQQMFQFLALPCSANDRAKIIESNDLAAQKNSGGKPFSARSELQSAPKAEPKGFFRKGALDGWKSDLTFWEKIVVWRHSRNLMHQCGYRWKGR